MKVVFLDIDGVINIWPNPGSGLNANFHKPSCINLEYLLNKVPDLRIVVSSSWRIFGLDAIRDVLKANGIDPRRIIDVTGQELLGGEGYRGNQIKCWLEKHPKVTDFAILDDESDMEPFMDKLVRTDSYVGLTQAKVERVMQILDKNVGLN